MRVLILDGSIWGDGYCPAAGWRQFLGAVPSVAVHLPSGEEVPSLAGFSHLVVTGSEASITGHEPWFDVEAEVISRAADASLPILASCFGHQMLALALSGREFVGPCPVPEIGWIDVELLCADPLLDGLPRKVSCFASHFDEVIDPPSPWRVLGKSDQCGVQVMRWGEKPIWGLQPHPEITVSEALLLLKTGIGKLPEAAGLFQKALEQKPRDDQFAQRLVTNFLNTT